MARPHPRPHRHAVRRILLPSGRSIEVVRFEQETDQSVRPLHVCPDCACELIQPSDWSEAADHGWRMTLGCPNCGWSETATYPAEAVEQLEARLDSGLEEMIDDLRRLTHANMVAEMDSFVAALRHDVILPEDF
ncbi:hypothetical protein [Conexibacter sp. DBS9H8]|uniref:hypothetical protein n=1 Tax=Conexibacter sp. DBS9H8 TaxID=2937801 RepID=UPI00200E7410|nr:hypothetical protein [Conexibacter sp. DBS9H8]